MQISKKLTVAGGLVAAGLLAACGGGGGGAVTRTPLAATSPSSGGAATQSTGTKITFTIPLVGKPARAKTAGARRHAAGTRKPQYVSADTLGVQVAVTSGTTTKTVYADTTSGANCANLTQSSLVCTIIVPTIGASETLAMTTVDQTPTGDTNGYGSGFPTNTNVLGIGSVTVTPTPGALTNVSLTINPIVGGFADCGISEVSGGQVGDDTSVPFFSAAGSARFVVTAGTPSVAVWSPEALGRDQDSTYFASPEPFVDVNNSAAPVTVTSSSSHFTMYAAPGGNTVASPGPYAQTISMADTSFAPNYGLFAIYVNYDGSAPAGTTIILSNNLSATPPWAGTPSSANYLVPVTWTLAPVSVTPTTLSVSYSGTPFPTSATVTGADYGATNGMKVASNSAGSNTCSDTATPSQVDATIASSPIVTAPGSTQWQQTFTVNTNETAPTSGTETCTFALEDNDRAVPTPTVTVTVYP